MSVWIRPDNADKVLGTECRVAHKGNSSVVVFMLLEDYNYKLFPQGFFKVPVSKLKNISPHL